VVGSGRLYAVLRTFSSPVRALLPVHRDEALALCARNPAANAFVAARIEDGALASMPGSVLGYHVDGALAGLAWAQANLVPAECTPDAIDALAAKVRTWRRQCASIFGPTHQVRRLWEQLAPSWGPARTIRAYQPLMSTRVHPSSLGMTLDERVRPATHAEVDLVLPAAAAMFTDEIGYPPYVGSAAAYRSVVSGLVRGGRTYVWVHDGRVAFKADVGSVGVGSAQIQGVWLAPQMRGRGLATALMATVTERVLQDLASEASLYVNDFNVPALATYRALGFAEVGSFTTVLL
jgi:predicted GNAT family acetyltransferase